MQVNEYSKLAKKYLAKYKPFKFQNLIMDGSIMDYLYHFQDYLNGYDNFIDIEKVEISSRLLYPHVL